MKKITSLVLFALPVLIFLSFFIFKLRLDENLDNLFEYVFVWLITLFILSILAVKLSNTKYKVWLTISIIVSIVCIIFVYPDGDGGGYGIGFDGEYMSMWFASLYSIVCVIYFIIDFVRNRKKKIN